MFDTKRKYYTYVLLDPRKPGTYFYGSYRFEHEPFYVGKGTGYRLTAHFTEAKRLMGKLAARQSSVADPLVAPESTPIRQKEEQKLFRIMEIMQETGRKPIAIKVRKDINEFESFEHEAELIRTIGREAKRMGPLTNETDGMQFPGSPIKMLMKGATGINNVIDPTRLTIDSKTGLAELAQGVNIDIDDSFRVSRRKGYTKLSSAPTHSLFSDGGECLVISGANLCRVNNDFSLTSLTTLTAPDNIMSYALIGDKTYFCNGTENGQCQVGGGVSPWVYENIYDGRTFEEIKAEALPSITSLTATAGSDDFSSVADYAHLLYKNTDVVNKYNAESAPIGKHVEYYNGRIYVSKDNFVFYSEAFTYHWFNQYTHFLPFESEVKMLKAVKDGLYIGTGHKIYFLRGNGPENFQLEPVSDASVIEYTDTKTWAENFNLERAAGLSATWLANDGIYLGLPGGNVINLTKDKLKYPNSLQGCSFCSQNKHVSVLRI